MSEELTNAAPQPEEKPKKKKMHGCLIAFLIFLGIALIVGIVGGILVFKGAKAGIDKIKEAAGKEFIDKGYESVTGQNLTINDEKTGDFIYFAQQINFESKQNGKVALLVQNAEIDNVIEGDLDFLGQTLTITDEGHIKGDLSASGQSVTINGPVDGKIEVNAQIVSIREDLKEKPDLVINSAEINTIPYEGSEIEADSLADTNDETESENVETDEEEAVTE